MIRAVLQQLIDEHQLTVREISQITERGESTIYRWLNGESQPAYRDVASLVRNVSNPQAREQLLCVILAGLPVVVEWLEGAERDEGIDADARDVPLRLSMRALQTLVNALALEQQGHNAKAYSDHHTNQIVKLLDEAIRNLTASKGWLLRNADPPRRRARPLGPPTGDPADEPPSDA